MHISERMQFIIWMQILLIFHIVEANPLFFANPFAATKPPEGELDTISVYTTEAGERKIGEQPSIYRQIARNALERIVSPVVSHFILTTATQSSRIVSAPTTERTSDIQQIPRKTVDTIETLDEEVSEDDSTTKAVDDVTESNVGNKEATSPLYIKNNPSFKTSIKDRRAGRIVLHPNSKIDQNVATEVDDLNKVSRRNDSVSETDESDNEVETIDTKNDTEESGNDSEDIDDEDDDENAPEPTTPKNKGFLNRNFSENGLIFVLEILGTIYTLGMGIVSSFFQNSSNAM